MCLSTLRELACAGNVALVFLGAWAAPTKAQQPVSPPIFSWDLNVGWIGMGDFKPVPGRVPPVSDDPKYPYVPNGAGRQPTYHIADLTNPNLKPWAKEVMRKDNAEVIAGKIAFTPSQSCLPAGVPAFLALGGNQNPYSFLQTPKEAWIMRSADSQVRRIYLDVPHSTNPKPSWYGESVGHYEGDTLVIDTIGLNDKTFIDNFRTPHSEKLHLVERLRLVEDGKFIEAEVTIEDPAIFINPLHVTKRARRVEATLAEWRCAAGEMNNAFANGADPLPMATKADF